MLEWQELQWVVEHCNGKSATANICRITLAVAVYYIWQERNARVFTGKQIPSQILVKMVIQEVILRCSMEPKLAKILTFILNGLVGLCSHLLADALSLCKLVFDVRKIFCVEL